MDLIARCVVDPNPHPYHFGNLDPRPVPHPHQEKIRRIRIRDKLDKEPDPIPHQLAYDNPKYMEYEPIWAFFQGYEPLFGS
jgi:hypothetical protein